MHAIKKFFDKLLAVACVVLFAVLVVTVVWQVFTRQVIQDPSAWTSELAQYLFVWLGLFGAALVFAERGHIAVDFVVRKLPERAERAVAVFVQMVIVVFAAVILIWGGYRVSVQSWSQALTGLPVNVGPLYLVMPITGVIIIFYAIYHTIAVLRGEEEAIAEDDNPDVI
ncbi:TRAP transporter small permease [Arthrobacter sp. VKM Ac-2550]|uniref:TRAP transporter small permease n=1 Tax=Crystallibacter permensis TaxID=1938888 RepID=UPI0022278AF5|nr:TRAP transporter small permease [Arthrobacter sp. VKM Ac-2550]MCW2131856.1 TRAP-type C4-dicarboxylate transport system, small permease component [Arthrobacter sp. VKM Ac-2550]